MSASSPSKREKKHHPLYSHITRAHSLVFFAALVFAITWAFWTFFLATPVSPR